MRSLRRLLLLVPFVFFVALAGCGGNALAPGASSVPAAYGQSTALRTVNVAAASTALTETSVPYVAPEAIVDVAPPNVAGTYNGTIEGRSQGSLIAKGPALFTIVQHGENITGNVRFELVEDPGRSVTRDLRGTVAPTATGAILHFSFVLRGGLVAGAWAKVDGGSFVGRGWQDPYAPDQAPYEQILFWAKAT